MSTIYICTRPNWSLLTLWRSLESTPTKMVPNLKFRNWKSLRLNFVRGFELDQNWKVSLPYQIFLGLELDLDIAGDMAALKVTRRSYLDLDVQKLIEILWLYSFLTHHLQLLGKLQTHRKLSTRKYTEKTFDLQIHRQIFTCEFTENHLICKSTEKLGQIQTRQTWFRTRWHWYWGARLGE